MLGVAEKVVCPERSDVWLLSMKLYPLVTYLKKDCTQRAANVRPSLAFFACLTQNRKQKNKNNTFPSKKAGETKVNLDLGSCVKGEVFKMVPVEILPVVLERQINAILALCERDEKVTSLVERLIFGQVRKEDPDPSALRDESKGSTMKHFNEQQYAAVQDARKQPLTLIQGPPGTGKSEVAVSIVEEWLQSPHAGSILVATGTHAAKGVLQRRFKAKGIVPSRRYLKQPETADEETTSTPVFVETVYMAAQPEERTLARVLLDESSQMTIAAALVALTRGCEQLVLIGDTKQLGPVSSFGSHRKYRREDLEFLEPFAAERRSIFELLEGKHQQHKLQLQYRMDPKLCAYPSERFYDGKLETAASWVQPSHQRRLPDSLVCLQDLIDRYIELFSFWPYNTLITILLNWVITFIFSGLLNKQLLGMVCHSERVSRASSGLCGYLQAPLSRRTGPARR